MSAPTFQRHEHGAWCHPAADGCPDEIPAPALTAEEAARIAVFDAAEEPEEVVVERVARAIMDADYDQATGGLMSWSDLDNAEQDHFRSLATAALTALRGDRGPLAGQHTTDEELPEWERDLVAPDFDPDTYAAKHLATDEGGPA